MHWKERLQILHTLAIIVTYHLSVVRADVAISTVLTTATVLPGVCINAEMILDLCRFFFHSELTKITRLY